MMRSNVYPGRGIICGNGVDGVRFCAYFLTARSKVSRNRRLVQRKNTVVTEIVDSKIATDSTLLTYTAMQEIDNLLVVANGDHSAQIIEGVGEDLSFAASLQEATYEPDEPHYTPRISALIDEQEYRMSIIRKRGTLSERSFYTYAFGEAGQARLLHTYEGEGESLPSFIGEPRTITIDVPAKEVGSWLWQELENSNRLSVALWILDGKTERILTINEPDGELVWSD